MNSSGSFSPESEPGSPAQSAQSPLAGAAVEGAARLLGIDLLPDPADFKSILVVKPSSLGDIVHAVPTVALLARAYPQLRLRWLVRPEFAPLLHGLPMIHELVLFPRAEFGGFGGIWRAIKWSRQLRQGREQGPEMILDLQGLLRSGLLSRARARRGSGDVVVGLSDAREGARWFHQHRVAVDSNAHAVARQLAAARALGAAVPDDEFDLSWPLAEAALPQWWPDCLRAERGNYVVLHPYSRGLGKALDQESIGQLMDALTGVTVVVVGQRPGVIGFECSDRVIDATNRTSLPELVAILRGAKGVISVDSGPAHLAAAVCPGRVISIHSRAHPRQVGPWRADAKAWFRGALAPMKGWLTSGGGVVEDGELRMPSQEELRRIAAGVLG